MRYLLTLILISAGVAMTRGQADTGGSGRAVRFDGIVSTSPSYQNDWDGGHLPSGVYYYTLSGDCVGHDRGVIRIFR